MARKNKYKEKKSETKKYNLYTLLKSNNMELFKQELSKELDLNKQYTEGNTLLHLACELNNIEAIKIILSFDQAKDINYAIRNENNISLFDLFSSNKSFYKLIPSDLKGQKVREINIKDLDIKNDTQECQSPRYDSSENQPYEDICSKVEQIKIQDNHDNLSNEATCNYDLSTEPIVIENKEVTLQGETTNSYYSYCIIM